MTDDDRLRRAAVTQQLRRKADEIMSRANALCDAADHRLLSSSELQVASRRLLRRISSDPRRRAQRETARPAAREGGMWRTQPASQ